MPSQHCLPCLFLSMIVGVGTLFVSAASGQQTIPLQSCVCTLAGPETIQAGVWSSGPQCVNHNTSYLTNPPWTACYGPQNPGYTFFEGKPGDPGCLIATRVQHCLANIEVREQ